MARLPLVEFRNQRDPKGYRLEWECGVQPLIRRNGRVREDLKDCLPLGGEEYLEFANVKDAEGLLDFVQRYGALTWMGNSVDCGERALGFLRVAQHMREMLAAVKSGPPRLSDELLEDLSFNALRIQTSLIWDPVNKRVVWQSRTSELIDSLWAQLIQAVTRGDQLRKCEYCDDWFGVGMGAGRRADAKFCSDDHRAAFNNRARRQRNTSGAAND